MHDSTFVHMLWVGVPLVCDIRVDHTFKALNVTSLAGYIPSFLGSNIKVVEWLPQNDLLAHKDIKAFVSHMGHNSLYESAYHGVPVVAFPLFGDQLANAKRAEHFGFGQTVDYQSSNSQEMVEAIEFVVREPRYLAQFCSFVVSRA